MRDDVLALGYMSSVGIDVCKGESMIAVLRSFGQVRLFFALAITVLENYNNHNLTGVFCARSK